MKRPFLRRRKLQAKRRSEAFTLPELLVGVVLGAVVLAALGGSVLVSQMRISTKIRTDIERRDALNRAIALMRSEISAADRITKDYPSDADCPLPNLYLEFKRQGSKRICYSSQTSGSLSRNFRKDRPWTGPCVLTRVGPMYRPDEFGLLEYGGAVSSNVIQVILDNVEACAGGSSSFVITRGQESFGNSILRDVDIQIKQTSNISTSFSARVGSSPLYSKPPSSLSNKSNSVCSWDAPQTDIPDTCIKNVYYLQKDFKSYTVEDGCNYDSCVITDSTGSQSFKKADVLVFTDREIRP